MTEFLSDDWLAELGAVLGAVPPAGSGSGTVQVVVTGVPVRRKVSFQVDIAAGSVAAVRPGAGGDPTAVVTWDYPVAVEELGGRVDPDATFMLGTKKVEGAYAVYLLELQSVLGGPAARAALSELAARTTVP